MKAAVQWIAEGGMLPEFLNQLHAAGIPLKNIRPKGHSLIGVTPAADYKRIRPAARRTGTRVRIRRKRGLAFTVQRYRRRPGLAVGVLGAAALLVFLSTRIWVIVPSGLDEQKTPQALAVVEEMGVAVGKPIAALKPKEISIHALSKLNSVIALTINMDGCIAHVDMVADNTNHPLANDTKLSNLVAARDGLIVRVEILQGTRMVKVGEGVTAGTLLASGAAETTSSGPLLGRAEGVVMARTSRTLAVEIPLTQQHWKPSGKPFTHTSFSFLSLAIPLSATSALPAAYTKTVDRDFLTVDDLSLPLGICREQITPLSAVTVTYTEEEAKTLAEQALTDKETRELGEAVIKERQVHGTLADGVYRLEAAYTCLENIAVEVPVTVVEGNS